VLEATLKRPQRDPPTLLRHDLTRSQFTDVNGPPAVILRHRPLREQAKSLITTREQQEIRFHRGTRGPQGHQLLRPKLRPSKIHSANRVRVTAPTVWTPWIMDRSGWPPSAVCEEGTAHGDETSCGQIGDSVPDFPLVDAG
jgi:hypothetical protein